jgi:hypothetical protein
MGLHLTLTKPDEDVKAKVKAKAAAKPVAAKKVASVAKHGVRTATKARANAATGKTVKGRTRASGAHVHA